MELSTKKLFSSLKNSPKRKFKVNHTFKFIHYIKNLITSICNLCKSFL